MTAPTGQDDRSAPALDERQRRLFRRRLLRWYRRNHRELPWRAPPGAGSDPYHVLVSEAMLQQTQVATVIPYFHRLLEAFPTIRDLAAADEQAVLRLWQGLGYYRRARNLHAAARTVVDDHAGQLPRDPETLRRLPGVGPYTAGAIASIAFGRAAPILDGNVARVLARWSGLHEPVDQPSVKNRLWDLAGSLVRGRHPGDFNQALMELGATVCTKGEPKCLLCPLADQCRARATGNAAELPVTSPRRQPLKVIHHVLAIHRNHRYLFQQRDQTGLWAGMWQLPTCEGEPGADPADDAAALQQWVKDRFGLTVEPAATPLGRFTHQTTHRTIRFLVHPARVTGGRLKPGAGRWRRLDEVTDIPLARPQQRVIALLQQDTANAGQ
jgi:A/G-specific adenine glycosylase